MTEPELEAAFLDPLFELLRIPSVSTGEGDAEGIQAGAVWVRDYIRSAGASAEVVETGGNPLVLGTFEANRPDATHEAPKVLIYGHYDVQGAEPLEEWETPPFEPTVKDGRIYARGASDDKGNFWPLLWTTCRMFQTGELPVHVRALVEGEEERGSPNVMRWLAADDEHADAAIIYDSGGREPTITLGGRGLLAGYVTVRTAPRDLHSGVYGGVVQNPFHVLARMIDAVRAGPDGRLPDALRAGIETPSDDELARWSQVPLVGLDRVGRALTDDASERFAELTGWESSLDINQVIGGDPRTVIPAAVRAYVSMRLAPGQRHAQMRGVLQDALKQAAGGDAEVSFEGNWEGVDAAGFDPDSPVLLAARRAFERTFGSEPVLGRLGGTLPLLDVLARKGVDTVFTGFAGGGDNIHAPNESYRLSSLDQGRRAARALLEELARLRL